MKTARHPEDREDSGPAAPRRAAKGGFDDESRRFSIGDSYDAQGPQSHDHECETSGDTEEWFERHLLAVQSWPDWQNLAAWTRTCVGTCMGLTPTVPHGDN
jgi:hypothetical protein